MCSGCNVGQKSSFRILNSKMRVDFISRIRFDKDDVYVNWSFPARFILGGEKVKYWKMSDNCLLLFQPLLNVFTFLLVFATVILPA